MKTTRALAFLFLVPFAVTVVGAQALSATDAKNHIGEKTTVCGKVVGEQTSTNSRGEPTFVNLDSPYSHQIFTILIWGSDRASVTTLPRIGSRACASGIIQDYRGVPRNCCEECWIINAAKSYDFQSATKFGHRSVLHE